MEQKIIDFGKIGLNESDINFSITGWQKVKCTLVGCSGRKKQNLKDLSINAEHGGYFCHHCNESGNVSAKQSNKPEFEAFKPIIKTFKPLSNNIYEFFNQRQISNRTIDRNDIELEVINGNPNIAFKYYLGENILNIKYRGRKKHFSQSKGGTLIPYKVNDIIETDWSIWTEGEIDALSFEEAGYKNAVSLPSGGLQPTAKNIDKYMAFLEPVAEIINQQKRYYLAFDKDAVGNRTTEEIARRLGKSKCFIVDFPKYTDKDGKQNQCKDANEVLMKFNIKTLQNCIEKAKPYPVEGIIYADNFKEKVFDLYLNGFPEAFKTRWNKFSNLLKYYNQNTFIITGVPSYGKSTFMDDYLISMSLLNGFKYAIFSPENKTKETHIMKMAQVIVGKPFLPNTENRMTEDELNKALDYIHKNFFFIVPPNQTFKMNDILEAAEYLNLKYGINGLLIDNWAKLSHLQSNNETGTKYVARILNELDSFNIKTGINTFLVAHPRKIEKDKSGISKEPNLYDIADSAHFYNLPDIGGVVHRLFNTYKDADSGETFIDFDTSNRTRFSFKKIREDFMGSIGYVDFIFDIKSRRYHEVGASQYLGNMLNYNSSEYDYREDGYLETETKTKIDNEEDIPF